MYANISSAWCSAHQPQVEENAKTALSKMVATWNVGNMASLNWDMQVTAVNAKHAPNLKFSMKERM